MKQYLVAALGIVLSTSAFATSIAPSPELSPELEKLTVSNVERTGTVLKRSHTFPIESFVVGIPVSYTIGACSAYAGHQEVSTRVAGPARIVAPPKSIELFAARDPKAEACIEIALVGHTVIPVHVSMNNESVPPHAQARKLIAINGRSLLVVVDSETEKVSVQPVRTLH